MTFTIVVNIFLFPSLQIEDGDIICFQKSAPLESEEQCRYPDVNSFLEYVQNRQVYYLESFNSYFFFLSELNVLTLQIQLFFFML